MNSSTLDKLPVPILQNHLQPFLGSNDIGRLKQTHSFFKKGLSYNVLEEKIYFKITDELYKKLKNDLLRTMYIIYDIHVNDYPDQVSFTNDALFNLTQAISFTKRHPQPKCDCDFCCNCEADDQSTCRNKVMMVGFFCGGCMGCIFGSVNCFFCFVDGALMFPISIVLSSFLMGGICWIPGTLAMTIQEIKNYCEDRNKSNTVDTNIEKTIALKEQSETLLSQVNEILKMVKLDQHDKKSLVESKKVLENLLNELMKLQKQVPVVPVMRRT